MSVRAQTKAVEVMEARRELPRTLVGGTLAMRAAGKVYLPQEPAESDGKYDMRLRRSILTNFYADTVDHIVSKVFSKPIALGEDVPPQLVQWCENADLNGMNLDTFAQQVFRDAVEDAGIGFIYVDMPPAIEGATRADDIASNRRPYMVFVKARDVLGWKSASIGGREVLTQLRLSETATRPGDDEFSEVTVDRVRVIERDRVRLYEVNDDGDWVLISDVPSTLGEIPLAVCYLKKTGFMTALPPLENLAFLGLLHWQSSSDQRNILHVARVPILFGKGFDEEKRIEISASSMVKTENTDADLKFVEHGGKAIDAGRQDLRDIEEQAARFGMELQVPRAGSATATGRAIDAADTYSLVQQWALALGDCIEQALGYMARWSGMTGDSGGSVSVNTDYGIAAHTATDLDTLTKARTLGEITRETYLSELQRRGVLASSVSVATEVEALENEGPNNDDDANQ